MAEAARRQVLIISVLFQPSENVELSSPDTPVLEPATFQQSVHFLKRVKSEYSEVQVLANQGAGRFGGTSGGILKK